MTNSVDDPVAVDVRCDDDYLWITLSNGRQVGVPLANVPRLLHAATRRAAYELRRGGRGLHWGALNEDISVADLLAGRGDRTRAAGTG